MIFQNIPIDNSEAIAEALTAAEIARQEAKKLRAELEQKNAELADADAALAELTSLYVKAADGEMLCDDDKQTSGLLEVEE